jgi:hypothetical protein
MLNMEVRSGDGAHIESPQAGVACTPDRMDLAISVVTVEVCAPYHLPRS